MSENVHILTDSNFAKEVLESTIPVLVDFWAEWCGPCRQIGPIIEELATEYKDKIKVCKLETDDNQKTPATYGISAVPTIILFKNGAAVERIIGLKSKKDLKSIIESRLQ